MTKANNSCPNTTPTGKMPSQPHSTTVSLAIVKRRSHFPTCQIVKKLEKNWKKGQAELKKERIEKRELKKGQA
ncbi:MAG: hypothetical protein GTO62_15690 [Planctomycetales bacterium]|nr:hypothetical protein [Planctomycetales bacterium]NIP70665.1 hypothetical protein [Planctomycetales bacterium]